MKDTFLIVTTVPQSLNFFRGQVQVLKKRFNVEAVSSPGERLQNFEETEKVKTYAITIKREISLLNDIQSLYKLYRLIKKIQPKVVHGNTPKGGLLSMLASYFNKTPIRIYFLHGLRYEGTSGIKRKFLMCMERIACNCATHVFSVSHGVKSTLYKDKITSKPVEIIWNGSINGINTEVFNPDNVVTAQIKGVKFTKENIIFGYVGRLVGDKGINELVSAFSSLYDEYSHIRLLLVGIYEDIQDPVSHKIKDQIKTHPGIFHVGYQKDVKPFLKLMDIFTFPSYREGFGIVLMEAAAMKTPAISSDITGCNEIIQNDYNGILIPPKNMEALMKAMEEIITHPEKITILSNQARDCVINKYNQKTLWNKALSTYSDICK
ncbi:glycosyltransferase family 4 protein [Galbibacter pacificus]|uniref:Glycosyltransferase family 4 protein n=1 Tax=Galbibacter pacificus TaxID=2996052 RepID=A0ABT6FRP0_9FLAO|nr:glycosyltransferase family 4 protein [Galbibacter pacificus]MDG3581739.1 glycosyltransferase family 4 protein [Galbibacter pacificus]MDG3585787.1 glycosyltransferase family 4 protein [Galbibacter pacificus]